MTSTVESVRVAASPITQTQTAMPTIHNKVDLSSALIVRKQTEERSQRFGIYRGSKLIEGGFFSVWSALSAAGDYRENGEEIIASPK